MRNNWEGAEKEVGGKEDGMDWINVEEDALEMEM